MRVLHEYDLVSGLFKFAQKTCTMSSTTSNNSDMIYPDMALFLLLLNIKGRSISDMFFFV